MTGVGREGAPGASVVNDTEPAVPGAMAPPVDDATRSSSPRVGARLGRFTLGGVLGHGAMATVFRGRDEKLGRNVAIKVMNLAIAARAQSAERFRREAQAVAKVKHPGIVEIFDFVPADLEHGDPAYIVSELIAGPTLGKLLEDRRGRLLPEVAALVCAEIAESLGVAHECGVIHRDVKPENVMLEKAGAGSRVVLTDFGVAHITGMETMTATGALVGSPAYMSPEQARGRELGPGVDIWALGILLYQSSTGHLPFTGKDPLTVIAAIAGGQFKRPSQVSAFVGAELESIILRCMRPDPASRYPTAGKVAEELRAFAAAAGLPDGRAALRRFLDDPDAFEGDLKTRVADGAVQNARGHARRGEFARALAEVGRATAYVPQHREAESVINGLTAKRRSSRLVAAAAAVTLFGAGGWFLTTHVRATGEPVVAEVAAVPRADLTAVAAGRTTPPPVASAPGADQPRPVTAPAEHPVTPAKPERTRRARVPAAASLAAPIGHIDEPDRAEAVVAPGAEATPPAAPALLVKAEEQPGSVTLRAASGLCYPSLDGDGPTGATLTRSQVPPGKHAVYCSLDKTSPRQLVGEIEVRPGRGVEKTIVVENGKPKFAGAQ